MYFRCYYSKRNDVNQLCRFLSWTETMNRCLDWCILGLQAHAIYSDVISFCTEGSFLEIQYITFEGVRFITHSQHKFGPSSWIGRRIRIQGTKRIMSVDVISFCTERVLFGNTVDHFQRSWIYYSFSTQVLILAILLKSVLYYSSHENERLTKLTTFETRCKRRSKLDTKASHKCSLDFSVCLAGRVLKNLPQELNGKSRPCKKQTKEKFYKM